MAIRVRTNRAGRLAAIMVAGVCAVASPLAGGCASAPTRRPGMPPSDAMLSVTVTPQRPRFQRPEREFAPARYIVEADGVLRAAVGEGVTVQTYPGRARDLTDEEWAALWGALLATGVLDPDDPRAVEGEMSLNPDPLRRAVVWARAGGRSAGMVVDPARDEATAALVTLLEELAWIRTPWEMSGEETRPRAAGEPDPAPGAGREPPPWETEGQGESIPGSDPVNPARPREVPPDSPDPFEPAR